jgi:hypothetical protein
MEESEYREGYRALNERPCRFEKALLTRCADCAHARRLNLAEREAVACDSETGWVRCAEWLGLLRPRAQFALQLVAVNGPLPHAKEMRVQCGGLKGLQAVLDPAAGEDSRVTDIGALLAFAAERFGNLDAVPFADVMKAVARFQLRSRGRGPR